MMKCPNLSTIFNGFRFSDRECLRFRPDYKNPFLELLSSDGKTRYSMETMTSGTSAAIAKRGKALAEVVERFIDHGVDWTRWTLTSEQWSDQKIGILNTARSFLAHTMGYEPVLIGLYKTGLSDESLVRSLFNGSVNRSSEKTDEFRGQLSFGIWGGRSPVSSDGRGTFAIDPRIVWTSPFVADRRDLAAYRGDCEWKTVSHEFEEMQSRTLIWKEQRVYPVAGYGQDMRRSMSRFTKPLVRELNGQILVAESTDGQILDSKGLFDGSVLRVTVFRRTDNPNLRYVPNNSLHIQLSRSGLVCSIGSYTGLFGYFSQDVTQLVEVFRAGGAQ